MNPRETAELKRRLNASKNVPHLIKGLYVTDSAELISEFTLQPAIMNQEELEKYLSLFKKILSGTPGQTFLPVDFTTDEVMNGNAHSVLMDALSTSLQDENCLQSLTEEILSYIRVKGAQNATSVSEQQTAPNYLVLLLQDSMDVPARDQNGEIDHENAVNVFSYFLCAVCPVKQSKNALGFTGEDGAFHLLPGNWLPSAPETGFLFPAYEEGGANIYRAMLFTHDASDLCPDFTGQVFGKELTMSAPQQQESFQTILSEALAEECRLDTVQAVHETISGLIEERKADKTAESLALTGSEIRQVLQDCGVPEEKAERFEERCAETFGDYAEIPAVNLVKPKQFQVEAPGVQIRVSPECTGLLETRMIDGRRYILVPADGDVEVNGMRVTD